MREVTRSALVPYTAEQMFALVEDIEIVMMDGLDISAFDEDALYLICTSTYGSGDVPDNARALYDSLDAQPKYLGHVRYGVIALGDRTYLNTFAFGGKKLRYVARTCPGGVAHEPPRSTYWPHMNLPLYSPIAPAAGR